MDTIAFHRARPLQSNIDLSEASLQHVMKQYNPMKDMLKNWDGGVMAKPETEALWFYVQQHAMGLAERTLDNDEPLGDYGEFVTAYHKDVQRKAMRMFYYILLICTRESRHASGYSGTEKLFKKHPDIEDFHKNFVSDASHDKAIAAICDNAPNVTLGEYTEFLVRSFTYCSYGEGFGGKKWASVARPLRDFVHGKISAEILMDTAFTLAHNNGPIFNKGMLYESCDASKLNKILDVQRSGQIPQLVAHHYTEFSTVIGQQIKDYVRGFSRLESGFTGRVDWTQVKNIKGQACYANEIQAQKNTGNIPSKVEQMKKQAKMKKVAAKAKAAAAKLLKGSLEIMPNVFVPKGKRSQS